MHIISNFITSEMLLYNFISVIGSILIINIEVCWSHVPPKNPIESFQLVSPNRTEEYVNEVEDNQFHVLTSTNVRLQCLSVSPIKIIFLGVTLNKIDYTLMEWNHTTNRYKVSIGFKSTPQATGSYSCVTVDEKEALNSTIYIFADDGTSEPFLLHWNRNTTEYIEIQEFKTENKILLPCITFKPSPRLFYDNQSQDPPYVPNGTYTYKPSEGFLVNIDRSNYTAFKCELTSNSSLKFKIADVILKVYPVGETEVDNIIYWHPNINKIFVECKAIYQVEITFEIKGYTTSLDGKGHSTSETNSFYKHIAKVSVNPTVFKNNSKALYGLITCKSTKNGKVSVSRIIKNEFPPLSTRRVNFNKETNQFYCKSSISNEIPIMTVTDCNNLANCDTVRRFSPLINMTKWEKYNNSTDKYMTAELYDCKNNDCAVVKRLPDAKFGMVHCLFGGKAPNVHNESSIASLQYFIDLNNNTVLKKDYKDVRVEDVLKIHTTNAVMYRGETATFTCEASTFMFSKGLQFDIIYKNSLIISKTPEQHLRNSVEVDNGYKITLNKTIYIWTKHIESIRCKAKKWHHKGWMNITLKIAVKENRKPFIDATFGDARYNSDNNSTKSIFFQEHNSSITCNATGLPLPEIEWLRIESLSTLNAISFNHNTNINIITIKAEGMVFSSTIVFTKVFPSDEGYYVCKAKSSVGETNVTFKITVVFKSGNRSLSGENEYPWMVYVIVMIGLIMLLLLVAIALFWRKLKSKQNEIENLSRVEIEDFMNGNEDIAKKYRELHEVAQYLPYKQEYEIHPSKIEITNEMLGAGNYGTVVTGILEKSGNKFAVAVKTVKSGTDICHLRALLSEIKIMMYIGKHPFIIEMIGAITKNLQDGKLFVAVEFCSNGNLQSYLRLCRPEFQNQIVEDGIKIFLEKRITKTRREFMEIENAITSVFEEFSRNSQNPPPLTTINLLQWCYQIASGMVYLAEKNVIHGDLAARNILITDNLSVKITDFGLARHLYEYSNYVTKEKTDPVPWRWLSIEAIQYCKYSTESDVWAYGVTLWEIFSLGEVPYQGFSWGEEFVQELCNGYRMRKPQYATNDIYNTMSECWNASANERPSFKDILNNFKELLKRVKDVDTIETENMAQKSVISEKFICSETA